MTGGFWVAEDTASGRIVGMIACEPPRIQPGDRVSPWRAEPGAEAELRRMSVAASHRGRGISRLLLAALERHARAKGFDRVVLGTSAWQARAVRAYPRLGFARVKTAQVPSAWLPVVQISFFAKELK